MNCALFTFIASFHTHNTAGTTTRKQFGMSQYTICQTQWVSICKTAFSPQQNMSHAPQRECQMTGRLQTAYFIFFYLRVQTVDCDRWKVKFKA